MTSPRLHGRDAPLRVLRDGLASAHEARGQLILLAGEAGIGKSALAEALAADATASHAIVTWGRAWEFAEAPAYFPLWPCMRAIGVAVDGGDPLDDAPAFELWERVLAALARAAEAETIVWLVEDVHAADLGTLDLLTYLAQPLRALRVLVVATLRPHDPRLGDRKLQRLARIARDGVEIRLDPLPEPAIAAIAHDTLGRALPDPALRRLAELTGGNPLFVVECARAFRVGDVDRVLDHMPPTVRHLVLERVALLPEATRRILDAGAVLGREVPVATLARMVGSQPARVIDELLPALRAGVLREIQPGQFEFSHVVVRDAIEDAIAPATRASLHAAADDALREVGDHVEVLVERARHALAAASAGDPQHALALARRAAEQLEREGAVDRAFELHARIEQARASGLLPPASPDDKLQVARIARDAGMIDVTQRCCDDVIDAARAAGDATLLARAALLHATIVRPGVIDPRQVTLLEEARAGLPASSPEMCRVVARLATALQPADDTTVPNEHARTALRLARATGEDSLIAEVLELGALGLWGAPRAERIAWCEQLRELAGRADDVPRGLTAWSLLALWFIEAGELEHFADACAHGLALADRAPHPRFRWDALLVASGYACALGNFAESERYVTEVNQIAALIDDPALELSLVFHELGRAKLRRRADDLAPLLDTIERASSDVKHAAALATVVRASCHARLGDSVATRGELAALGTQACLFERDNEELAMLAEAYALAGSDDERRWVREVLASRDVTDFFSIGYTYESTTERALGLLDASLGDLESAEARLRHAHELATRRRMRPWIAQLAHELAQVVARRGGDASALVEQATTLGRELGMAGFGATLPVPAAAPALRIERSGDVWTLARASAVARVKDSRGMQLLVRLIEHAGEELHVLALASDEGASAPDSDAGEMLDERARKAYRMRLAELDDAIEIAEQRGDARRSRRLSDEKSALVRELARATGLGGRARKASSATERARVNVQRRLKDAIARVGEADRELGAFLDQAVRTGTYCCFRP